MEDCLYRLCVCVVCGLYWGENISEEKISGREQYFLTMLCVCVLQKQCSRQMSQTVMANSSLSEAVSSNSMPPPHNLQLFVNILLILYSLVHIPSPSRDALLDPLRITVPPIAYYL